MLQALLPGVQWAADLLLAASDFSSFVVSSQPQECLGGMLLLLLLLLLLFLLPEAPLTVGCCCCHRVPQCWFCMSETTVAPGAITTDSLRIVDAAQCCILTERCHRQIYTVQRARKMGVQSVTRDKRLNIVETSKLNIGCTAGICEAADRALTYIPDAQQGFGLQ
jgi:hypothetical protein